MDTTTSSPDEIIKQSNLMRPIIENGNDGPVNIFVMISRATQLVEEKKCSAEVAANALYGSLSSFKFLNWTEEEMKTLKDYW